MELQIHLLTKKKDNQFKHVPYTAVPVRVLLLHWALTLISQFLTGAVTAHTSREIGKSFSLLSP